MLQRRLPGGSSQQLRRAAAQVMNGAKRAAMLTRRLLAFSRRQSLEPKPTDPNALVAGMSDMLRLLVKLGRRKPDHLFPWMNVCISSSVTLPSLLLSIALKIRS